MPVGYDAGRLAILVLLGAGLYVASLWTPHGSETAGLAMRAALVLLLPAGLWTSGFFRAEEKAEIRSILAGLAGPLLRR